MTEPLENMTWGELTEFTRVVMGQLADERANGAALAAALESLLETEDDEMPECFWCGDEPELHQRRGQTNCPGTRGRTALAYNASRGPEESHVAK